LLIASQRHERHGSGLPVYFVRDNGAGFYFSLNRLRAHGFAQPGAQAANSESPARRLRRG